MDNFLTEISPKGYLPDYVQKMMQGRAESALAEERREQRLLLKERKVIQNWLNNLETIGCCFPFELLHERKEDDAVIWDGKEDGVATVITNGLGRKKTAYVIPQNRDGKCALIPIKVKDYIFHAETIKINGEKVRLVKVYQMVDEFDGRAMWQLINVCLSGIWCSTKGCLGGCRKEKEWDEKIPPRFVNAFRAVNARYNGSTIPFAE